MWGFPEQIVLYDRLILSTCFYLRMFEFKKDLGPRIFFLWDLIKPFLVFDLFFKIDFFY